MIESTRQLSNSDKESLKKIVGKKITDLRVIEKHDISAPIGIVIIDFEDGFSLQIDNDEKPVKFFDNEDEEVVGFSCKEFDETILDKIPLDKYSVPSSIIESVEIISDTISFSVSGFDDFKIIQDCGIILHGDKKDYVFSLDSGYFFETILYSTNGDYNKMRPIKDVEEAWCEDNKKYKNIKIERSSTIL